MINRTLHRYRIFKIKNQIISDLILSISYYCILLTLCILSEIILVLTEYTLENHYKSMFDMIDDVANVVRSHQLLMLPDSDMDTRDYRKKYGMETRYRLQPKCFGNYDLY